LSLAELLADLLQLVPDGVALAAEQDHGLLRLVKLLAQGMKLRIGGLFLQLSLIHQGGKTATAIIGAALGQGVVRAVAGLFFAIVHFLQAGAEQLALFFQLLAAGFQGLLGGAFFRKKGIASAADLGELIASELFQPLPFRL
jgi:hypothetical protein